MATLKNTTINDTGHFTPAIGTTAQRPASPVAGMIRYNTTLQVLEQYTSDGWVGIEPPPVITAISPTNELETDDPQSITITGSNFATVVTVQVIGTSLTVYTPSTTTRNSSTSITITFAGASRLTGTQEPYDIKVINGSGLSAVIEDALYINNAPTWNTASGSLATVYETVAMSPTVTVSATDPEGTGLTYSVTSGSLPTGVSISSGGVISGTPNAGGTYSSGGVTHSFNLGASDGAQTTNRSFSILRKWLDGSTSAQAAPSGQYIRNLGITTNGTYWIKPPGGSGTAFQAWVINSRDGGGWVKVAQNFGGYDLSSTSAINAGGTWTTAEYNLAGGKLSHTDIQALQSTGTNTSFLFRTNPEVKAYRYWRYVEGGTITAHHPRVSRIIMRKPDGTDINTNVFTSDNCSDAGAYQLGTLASYDFGSAVVISHVSSYTTTTAVRNAYFTVQGSNDNSNWTNIFTGQMSATGTCGIIHAVGKTFTSGSNAGYNADPLLNSGYGTGKYTTTSGTLAAWGTPTDPSVTYNLSLDYMSTGTYSEVVQYTNDGRTVCGHGTTPYWYTDHNYNGSWITGTAASGPSAAHCFSINGQYMGTNLHWMGSRWGGGSNGEMYYGINGSNTCMAFFIK